MMDVFAININFNEKLHPEVLEKLLSLVDPTKKERLLRFYREEDKLRGLFADLLIRQIIKEKIGLDNNEISFDTNEFGKPFLKGRDDVHFNLSHSGDWVVGAVDNQPVGIDVEQVQDIDLDISKNYFSSDEHEDLLNQPDKFDYFFTLWSLKESYIKILGKGLSHPLNAFSIKFHNPNEIVMRVDGKAIDEIFFKQFNIDKKYKMAVCASHDKIPQKVSKIESQQLIAKVLKESDN